MHNQKHKIVSNSLLSIFKTFLQFTIGNLLRKVTNIGKTKTNHQIFFKNLFNKSVLVSRSKKASFLKFRGKKKDLGF